MFVHDSGCCYKKDGGDRRLVALLVFKTSVGFVRTPGGFDPHSPPLFSALSTERHEMKKEN